MTRRILFAAILLIAVVGLALSGCGDSETAPPDAPDGHTTIKDGVAHMSGLTNPTANCTSCHGDDLRGGDDGEPSCYSCHGQEW